KETNTPQEFEFSFELPNGRKLETLTIINYLHFLSIEPLFYLIISDISSLEEANRKIISFVQKEQELFSLKNRFISIVNHELMSPLTAITLAVDLLQRFGDSLPIIEKEKQFEIIRNSAQTIKKLIENAMHLEQLTSDNFFITPRKMYIKDFLEDIVNKLQALFENKNPISINIASDFEIEMDEILLNLIFNNLITNSFRYSPPGSPITINVEYQDNWLIASINNFGEVISPEDIINIFKPFFRGKNVGKTKGFGLGLSLVKKAVETLNGTIEVKSSSEEGTTFLLRLPTNLTI
ncbi:MAG: sensor histidine kinase, partial [Candidatus Kapaibacteriota bacterium]